MEKLEANPRAWALHVQCAGVNEENHNSPRKSADALIKLLVSEKEVDVVITSKQGCVERAWFEGKTGTGTI